jgi:phospholipid/cholesterol/gamma-HCH transport system substrate-binding protein
MKLARNEGVVGGFMLVAVAAGMAFMVAKAGSQGWLRGTKHFKIKTADGHNIREAAAVRMSGIQVGVVEDVEMDPTDALVEVSFRVEPRFAKNLRKDSVAMVVEPPILGAAYVDVKPGSLDQPELPTRGDIHTEEAQSLFDNLQGSVADLKSIVSKVNVFVDDAGKTMKEVNVIAQEVAEGKSVAGRAVNDPAFGQDVATIVKNAAKVSDDLADATAAIRRREGAIGRLLQDDTLVRESEALLTKTRESLATLDKLTADLTGTLEKIAGKLDAAGVSMDQLKAVIDNTAKLSGELASIAQKVNEGKGTLGKLMNDDAIFVEAKGVLKELRESVQDLREQAPINSFIGVIFSAF